MKIHSTIIIILPLIVLFLFAVSNNKTSQQLEENKKKSQLSILTPTSSEPYPLTQSIFIPYWALEQDNKENKYSEYYYFGVTPTGEGKLEQEQGKKNIELLDDSLVKRSTLVIRMMDRDIIESLINNNEAAQKLEKELRNYVIEKDFKGIAFDIEIPFSLNTDKPIQITKFVQQMCSSIKSDYKTCDLIVYGDTFYRNRPFDIKSLGAIVDRVLIMTYDFHKAGGEPGPNFPFSRKDVYEGKSIDYGYDFKVMMSDFMTVVPREKLVVIFGMYGYDWTLNPQGLPIKSATALSVNNLKVKAEKQQWEVKSNEAKEKNIEYTDEEGSRHIVWYEDEESVTIKKKYLQGQGVSQISFWASGYF